MRFALACLFSAAIALSAPVAAQAPAGDAQPVDAGAVAAPESADALLEAFASMPGLEAEFVEEKHIALLAAPLVSSGRLYFAPPGFLHRVVESPTRSTTVVTPERVRFTDDTGTEEIALAARPELRALVESMVWLLAGDIDALRGVYSIAFEPGDDESWALTLTPQEEPLSHLIARMEVLGAGLRVETIRVVETTGDETVTRITDANPAREFSPDERTRLFEDGAR